MADEEERADRRSLIGLGDLVRAAARLAPADPAAAEAIARCLGFAPGAEREPEGSGGAADPSRRHARRHAAREPRRKRGTTPPPTPPAPLPPESLDARLESLPPVPPDPNAEAPAWLSGSEPLDSTRAAVPPRLPLLPTGTARGVLFATTATRREGGEPDIHRVIRTITSGRLLQRLPYLPEASLHRGLDLLLDASAAMAPFRDDLAGLIDETEKLVGAARCRIYEFDGDPAGAVEDRWDGAARGWVAQAGRPVLLATGLGIDAPRHARRRPSPARFVAFARDARRRGVPVVALVPHGPDFWPPAIHRHLTVVHWDPATRAEAVRRLVGPGLDAMQGGNA